MSVVNSGVFVSAPGSAPTVAAGSGSGSMTTSGNYLYKVTYVTGWGETDPSSASSTVVATNGSVSLSAIPVSSDSNVTGRNIYRTVSGGSTYLLVKQILNNYETTYTDTVSDATQATGAAIPTDNQARSLQQIKGSVKFNFPASRASASTAPAGSTAADAAQLPITAGFHICTGADAIKGVKLPQITADLIDMEVQIKNVTAAVLKVYPYNTSDTIDGSTGAYSQVASVTRGFHATSATAWVSF